MVAMTGPTGKATPRENTSLNISGCEEPGQGGNGGGIPENIQNIEGGGKREIAKYHQRLKKKRTFSTNQTYPSTAAKKNVPICNK